MTRQRIRSNKGLFITMSMSMSMLHQTRMILLLTLLCVKQVSPFEETMKLNMKSNINTKVKMMGIRGNTHNDQNTTITTNENTNRVLEPRISLSSSSSSSFFFEDPNYKDQQWVYDMIYVEDVWRQGFFGKNIRVRVNDNGVEATHPEFQNRFDVSASCPNNQYLPEPNVGSAPAHGTSVAGILGGAANNGVCSVGIAPQVTISACNVFLSNAVQQQAWTYALNGYDISQNSYGVDGCAIQSSSSFVRQRQRQRQLRPISEPQDMLLLPSIPSTIKSVESSHCPFTYREPNSRLYHPCDICPFGDQNENDTGIISDFSPACESTIKAHCRFHFEKETDGCLDFLDVILGNGNNCQYDVLSDLERSAIVSGIQQGRNGKGIIYVFASGNAFTAGDDTNTQRYTNSRFIISVGAVGKDKIHSSYSTPGASLFVSAPGGDLDHDTNHITSGLGGSCIDAGVGTSFSCPVVSGVIALMLEANPDLTWRDVQYILAGTSQRVLQDEIIEQDSFLNNDEKDSDTTATENAAGYWHSHLYGFGIIDAAAAVEVAMSDWTLVNPEQMIMVESAFNLNLPIVDRSKETTTTTTTQLQVTSNDLPLSTPDNTNLQRQRWSLESVTIQLDIESFSRGHLEIILTSPSGTKSILHPGRRPENTQLDTSSDKQERWKLMTVRNWGESPLGEWTLSITDLKEGEVDDCASDGNWGFELGSQRVDCQYLDQIIACQNGQIDPQNRLNTNLKSVIFNYRDPVTNQGAQDACCSCGGSGLTVDDVSNVLNQWTMILYGTTEDDMAYQSPFMDDPSPSPTTPMPTNLPTENPSLLPTMSPTVSPTEVSTESPTKSPTDIPTKFPTGIPSSEPSLAPTMSSSDSPTFEPTRIESANPTILEVSTSPTIEKSVVPTPIATRDPSSVPTVSPSFTPTVTIADPSSTTATATTTTTITSETEFPTASPSVALTEASNDVMTPSGTPTSITQNPSASLPPSSMPSMVTPIPSVPISLSTSVPTTSTTSTTTTISTNDPLIPETEKGMNPIDTEGGDIEVDQQEEEVVLQEENSNAFDSPGTRGAVNSSGTMRLTLTMAMMMMMTIMIII